MYQIIYCECGERDILEGRCAKCGKVRPSSQEFKESIEKCTRDLAELKKNLKKARRLEKENHENKKRICK